MKIAYIYPSLTTIGGADRVIIEKANYFADKCGYEVYMITDSQLGLPTAFPLSPKVKHFDLGMNFFEQYRHSFLTRGYIYFKLMRIYKRKLNELLNSLQLDFTITTLGKDADFLTTLKDGSKKIAESHISKEYIRNLHLLKQRGIPYRIVASIWTKRMEKAIKKMDAFVVLTDNDAKKWNDIKKAIVIPNSLPFYPEERSKCNNKQVISVGRLYPQKGYDMLIPAWEIVHKQHSDWILSIYGNGEQEKELKELICQKGLEQCLYILAPVKNIMEKYLESSFYVMSSRFEGFGMTLIEAMACGIPCISFTCPNGPADIIKNNEDGILVDNGNVNQLAEKIIYLIEHEQERTKMGEKAKENVKRYMPDIIMQKWISLFESLKKEK